MTEQELKEGLLKVERCTRTSIKKVTTQLTPVIVEI